MYLKKKQKTNNACLFIQLTTLNGSIKVLQPGQYKYALASYPGSLAWQWKTAWIQRFVHTLINVFISQISEATMELKYVQVELAPN